MNPAEFSVTQAVSGRPLPIDWLRGVSGDARIGALHRLVLVGLGLRRYCNDSGYDAVANEIGVDRATVLRAVDIGVRRGWLLAEHGERVLTFPARQDRPRPPAEPSTTSRRAQ